MLIRLLTDIEQGQFIKLVEDSLTELFGESVTENGQLSENDFLETYPFDGEVIYLGAFNNNKLIGAVVAQKKDEIGNLYYISDLYVFPKFRKRGIGTQLVSSILAITDTQNQGKNSCIDVDVFDKRLRRFWKQQGFQTSSLQIIRSYLRGIVLNNPYNSRLPMSRKPFANICELDKRFE